MNGGPWGKVEFAIPKAAKQPPKIRVLKQNGFETRFKINGKAAPHRPSNGY
jgi:hypothetical protein